MRIVVSPRSARIWLPIPHSRASGREPECKVRLDGVEAVRLQVIRAELVQEADSAAFLTHVQDDALPLGLDAGEGHLQLFAAVAQQRVEHVTGQALGVNADEDVLGAIDVSLHQRDVLFVGQELSIRDRLELPELGREAHRNDALDELLDPAPVLDEVGDRHHLELVALAVGREIGNARHRPVVVHDLADDPGRNHACEPGEIDRRFGLAGALQHAASFCAEREDVSWLHQIGGTELGSIATWIVRARSWAEIPVETPSRASIETVKSVPSGVSL